MLVVVEVVRGRCVVGSYGGVLEENAEVLGEVRVLDHVQALVLVQLGAPRETGSVTHAQEL